MQQGQEPKVGGRLDAQKRLGKMIVAHYQQAHEVAGKQKIAWVSTGAPTEILWAMDFYVQLPEAHAATCGARKMAHQHCLITEGNEYERHLCTYCRNSIGSTISDINGAGSFEPLAKPDFLLVANNSCSLITKWWEHLSHYWQIPMINIDCPLIIPEIGEKKIIDHVKRQCLDLIKYLEEFTGRKMDYDKLQEVVKNGQTSVQGYRKIGMANANNPAPVTYFDLMPHNFPNLVLRYKPEAAEHYQLMLNELEQRIADGVVPFEDMKYRIYWDGIPYWFAIRTLSTKLRDLGMCLVTSGYPQVFTFEHLDPQRPLDSVAENTALFYLNRPVTYKLDSTTKIFEDYNIDAGIFAYALSCKPFSITMHYIADQIRQKMGIPVTMIEGDLVDETLFDEAKTEIKLEALAEMLEAR